jgi:hypothetical protein
MKKLLYITGIILYQIIVFTGASQNPGRDLNQALLMKQLEGVWKCDIGTDTTAFWSMVTYGTGYEASLKYITKGKIIKEGKGLYGYDRKIDKIVEAGITKGKDIGVYVMWFITENKFVLIPFTDLAKPEMALFKMEGEFITPDNLIETTISENKTVKIKNWTKSNP